MERRSDKVIEKLRRWTHFRVHAETDENGIISMSNDLAVMLEDLCGEAADMIIALREQIDKETVITVDPPKYSPIGSYGDSVTLDEIQKKYEEYKQQTFSNLQSEGINPGDNCRARLPCGICRNTMMQCPLSLMQPAWTCSSSTATNQAGGEA